MGLMTVKSYVPLRLSQIQRPHGLLPSSEDFQAMAMEAAEGSLMAACPAVRHGYARRLVPAMRSADGEYGAGFPSTQKDRGGGLEGLGISLERGFAFRGCGCDAGGYIPPMRVRDIPAFLDAHYPDTRLPKKKRYARKKS
jgi:hypothetical protein